MANSLLSIAEELRGIAQLGLHYTHDRFDKERYERLLRIASTIYSEISDRPVHELVSKFANELGHVTPKVGVNGALFSNNDRIFLTRRTDDGTWELPGGWADLGESPRDALVRELSEETNLEIEVGPIIEVFHRLPGDFSQPHTTYHLLFGCSTKALLPTITAEISDYGFFEAGATIDWHRDHKSMADAAFRFRRAQISSK